MDEQRSRTTTDILGGILAVLVGAGIVTYSATVTRISVTVLAWIVIVVGVLVALMSYAKREENTWWVRLAGGALVVMLGIVFLTHPATTRLTLTILAGVYFIVSGGMRVIASYGSQQWRVPLSVGGIASIVMGALLMSRLGDGQWASFLGLMIGLELIVEGLTWALTGTSPAMRMSARALMSRFVDRGESHTPGGTSGLDDDPYLQDRDI